MTDYCPIQLSTVGVVAHPVVEMFAYHALDLWALTGLLPVLRRVRCRARRIRRVCG